MNPVDCLHQARKQNPGRVMFVDADRSLDAATLFEKASRLAVVLRAGGVGRGSNVALYLPRGLDAVVAVYGILLAGGCYVPLNCQCPRERNQFILQHAGCQIVIVNDAAPDWLGTTNIELLPVGAVPDSQPAVEVPLDCDMNDPAAILYTSGSSGEPKGVVISLRAISAFSEWCVATFALHADDRIASLAPFNFDLSLFDLFAVPAAGAQTCFVPDALTLAPARLVAWLDQHAISVWYTVPSMLVLLTLRGGLEKRCLPRLRQVLYAGEVFPTPELQRLGELLPDADIFNLFGPTETNVCLYWPVDRAGLQADLPVPVGRPACGAVLAIDSGQGELLVKGPCLMSGYWQDGRAVPAVDAQGWYHTGDRVTMNALGEYEFHGRLDRMIKSSGYRIEPAEIEQVLRAVPGVVQAVVVGIPDSLSGTRIAAAVTGDGADHSSLRNHANKKLASWMQPSFYLFMNHLPHLPNGKTDYRGITRAIEQALSS